MAAGENAENWLETKLERCYPELQPEIIEELVQAVTPEMPYSLLGPNPPTITAGSQCRLSNPGKPISLREQYNFVQQYDFILQIDLQNQNYYAIIKQNQTRKEEKGYG